MFNLNSSSLSFADIFSLQFLNVIEKKCSNNKIQSLTYKKFKRKILKENYFPCINQKSNNVLFV
jgi:hypothetical protein